MSDRKRHLMIELQREYRARPVTYARVFHGMLNGEPVFGDEIKNGPGETREQIRRGIWQAKRERKREATRTKRQLHITARRYMGELLLIRLKIAGHDTQLHPDNPYIDPSLRRKLRKQGKGKILTGKPVIEAASTTPILLPKDVTQQPKPKESRVDGLKRRASGLFVPVRDRLK